MFDAVYRIVCDVGYQIAWKTLVGSVVVGRPDCQALSANGLHLLDAMGVVSCR